LPSLLGLVREKCKLFTNPKPFSLSTHFYVLHNKENKFEDWNVLPPSSRYSTKLHGVITTNTAISTLTDLRTSPLAKVKLSLTIKEFNNNNNNNNNNGELKK